MRHALSSGAVNITDRNTGPSLGEEFASRTSYTAPASGNQYDFIVEPQQPADIRHH
jgi:hypothetical protein